MFENWKELSEKFLRNECKERERRLVMQALRDRLIDDDFKAAIDSVLQSVELRRFTDTQGDVPEEIEANLLEMIRNSSETFTAKKREAVSKAAVKPLKEWLKIAAAVVIAVSVTWAVSRTDTFTRPKEQRAMLQTIEVPAGQTVSVTLADGSKIWLNSSTVMKYPGSFDGDRREVWLNGEAYIEVAKNRDKPFVVHAGKYDVTALGTTLNVEAYHTDSAFTVSLFDGIVDVSKTKTSQKVRLQPNTKINGALLQPEIITNTDHYRWREGLLCYRDASFAEIMKSFEDTYGINIVIENRNALKYKCSVKFRRYEGVEYALRVLQRDVRFRYIRDEDNKVIYIR
jgi:ferric-dicitrate binding protein FerR (iron transport regulator)